MSAVLQQPAPMSTSPSLTRSTLLNLVDTGISMGSAVLISVLLARTLGPDRFGIYSLVLTLVTFTYLLVRFGINETVRRYVAELDGQGRREVAAVIAGRGVLIGLGTASVAAVALGLAAAPLANLFHHSELQGYLILGAVTLIPTMAAGVLRNVLRGIQQYRYFVRINLITSPLWLIACALAVWSGLGIMAILGIGLAIEVLNVCVFWRWVRREVGVRFRGKLPAELRRRLLNYNLALAALIVLEGVVWQRSEVVFLAHFSGADQVAYYTLPFSLTERLGILLPGALLGVLLPGLAFVNSTADPERFSTLFSDSMRYLAMLTLPLCLFAIPLSGTVIAILYGEHFSAAVLVLQILLVATVFNVLGEAASAALLGLERQGWLLKTGAIAAAASIGLNLLLIPRWGAVGAAVANTAAQAAWSLAAFAPLWRRVSAASRQAFLQSACLAGILTLGLVVIVAAGVPLPGLVIGSALSMLLYLFALNHLRLLSARHLLARLRPNAWIPWGSSLL
jgi:O-antigen/teichoic acid export membrane protein